MKMALLGAIGLVAFLSVSFAAQKPMPYTGEIMDSQCANADSHDKMIDVARLKGREDCALHCVKLGGTFVLFDAATKVVYQLDDQKKPKSFAAEKVIVTGTPDTATMTIHVKGIQHAPNGRRQTGW